MKLIYNFNPVEYISKNSAIQKLFYMFVRSGI